MCQFSTGPVGGIPNDGGERVLVGGVGSLLKCNGWLIAFIVWLDTSMYFLFAIMKWHFATFMDVEVI